MRIHRRAALAAGIGSMMLGTGRSSRGDVPAVPKLGVVSDSFAIRRAEARTRGATNGFLDPLVFLDAAHELGAAGIQVDIGARDDASVKRLQERLEDHGMFFEASVRLPRDARDVPRFEAEVRTATSVGALVIRTVMLSGRRYELFSTLVAFRKFATGAYESLTLAEPVIARSPARLAVENHKDFRAEAFVAMLKRLSSERVGACLDSGNNMALLEDPMAVIETLAPWTFTVHLKDMGVEEYEEGFLLAEVPLGTGILDLARIVKIIRAARPEARFNLEMITRDPLKIPCLTQRYWATFPDLPGSELARSLAFVRAKASKRPLTRISRLSQAEKLELEFDNIRKSLAYAHEHLSL